MARVRSVYYRALITGVHLERWRRQMFTSFHNSEPPEWWSIWSDRSSTNVEDYPLNSVLGVFTDSAREAFVRLAQVKPDQADWSPDERRIVSEVAGVFAYKTPDLAWRYGLTKGSEDYRRFVEFTGELVCLAPEEGGVVVRVESRLTPAMSAQSFKARHGL